MTKARGGGRSWESQKQKAGRAEASQSARSRIPFAKGDSNEMQDGGGPQKGAADTDRDTSALHSSRGCCFGVFLFVGRARVYHIWLAVFITLGDVQGLLLAPTAPDDTDFGGDRRNSLFGIFGMAGTGAPSPGAGHVLLTCPKACPLLGFSHRSWPG